MCIPTHAQGERVRIASAGIRFPAKGERAWMIVMRARSGLVFLICDGQSGLYCCCRCAEVGV